ncbi:MAG: hypothetical protein M1835_001203 [Candelina submexicana]|nr:MAG: hypothetical protein M1835_001203 [Candelina submexicana]
MGNTDKQHDERGFMYSPCPAINTNGDNNENDNTTMRRTGNENHQNIYNDRYSYPTNTTPPSPSPPSDIASITELQSQASWASLLRRQK